MDWLLVFNPLRLLISSLNISLYYFFFLFFISPFSTQYSCFLSPPHIWLYEKLKLLFPPIVSPSWYQPKHYRNRKLKDKEMDPTQLTELLKHLTSLDVQWVVEWWCIKAMSSCDIKKNRVPLVGLCHCSYYPTCHITQKFDDR